MIKNDQNIIKKTTQKIELTGLKSYLKGIWIRRNAKRFKKKYNKMKRMNNINRVSIRINVNSDIREMENIMREEDSK